MCLIFVGSYKQVSSSYKSDQKNIWLPRLNYFLGKKYLPSYKSAPLCSGSVVILIRVPYAWTVKRDLQYMRF